MQSKNIYNLDNHGYIGIVKTILFAHKKTPLRLGPKGFGLFYQIPVFIVKVIFEIRIGIPGLDFHPFFML